MMEEKNNIVIYQLAAGKTMFTKGIGQALNIKEVINSPTFTILKIYEGDMTLYHIDAYRLYENPYDLGFEEYTEAGGIMVIEWYDYIKDQLDVDHLSVDIKYIDEDTRSLCFKAHGKKYEEILKELEKC